jgi:hypothetical protein
VVLTNVSWVPITGGLVKVTWEADEDPDSYAVNLYSSSDGFFDLITGGVPDPSDREIDLAVGGGENGNSIRAIVQADPSGLFGTSNDLPLP